MRARKWNAQDAFVQFKDTEEWRKTNQIDRLYDRIDVDEYDAGRKLVCGEQCHLVNLVLITCSIRNGQAAETNEASHSMSLRSLT